MIMCWAERSDPTSFGSIRRIFSPGRRAVAAHSSNVDTMPAGRARSAPQALCKPFSAMYSFCSFTCPDLQNCSITFVLLLSTYYLWAITLAQFLSAF